MADNNRDTHVTRETHVEKSRSGSGMAFILGGVVVAVLVIAYFVFGGTGADTGAGDTNVNVEAPAVEGAADDAANAVEGAAESAGDAAEEATDGAN